MNGINCKIFVRHLNLYNKLSRPGCSSINCVLIKSKINNIINNVAPMTTAPHYVNSNFFRLNKRLYSSETSVVDSNTFEKVCDETLESLCEYFEELVESAPHLQSADVTYGSGVLTVNFGNEFGTYVINRQSPNQQIWLSSPLSGPKRYDFVPEGNYWVYKHDKVTLHSLLQQEIKDIIRKDIDFSRCSYSLLNL